MKKIIIYTLSVVFCCSSFSCSSETQDSVSNNSSKDEIELSKLKGQIVNINSSYTKKEGTRMPKWLRWLIFGSADVAGFVLGDVAGATGASTLAWTATKEEKQLINSDIVAIKMHPDIIVDSATVGYLHNKFSKELFDNYGNALDTMSVSSLTNAVCKIVSRDKSYGKVVDENELKKVLSGINENFNPNASISENINKFKSLTVNNQQKSTLDLCSSVLDGLQNVDDSDTTYIAKVNKAIEQSQINPSLKKNITESVSVANASALLWNGDALKK